MRALQQMEVQSQRMELLINDLLLLARLEGTDIVQPHQPVRLDQLCASVCENSAPLAAAKQQDVHLDIPEGLSIMGDADELGSAVTNLLTNAINYTGDNGKISLRWHNEEDGGRLDVSDNGPGIEAHHLPRLTERFYRPDASRITATGGTGLGLAIVKHILLRHDARLDIASTPGQGSCFSCCFPAHKILMSQDV